MHAGAQVGAPVDLGHQVFTDADQQAFARLSGDVNPMHMDAIAARRLISGRQVVHGVHLALQLLERFAGSAAPPALPGRVECSFDQPVSVGDPVRFAARTDAQGRTELTASVDGRACTVVRLGGGDAGVPAPLPAAGRVRSLQGLSAPLDEEPGSQSGTEFTLHPASHGFAQAFASAAGWLGLPAVAALGGLSYVVGMAVPGLHSVFSSLLFAPGSEDGLRLQVRRWDPRFRLFIVDFRGALDGELRAFVRPPPQAQPTTRELAAQVRSGEFAGTRSLVVGGSRGLGELAAKLLAAGGGDVGLTFAAGREDALRVAADIETAGAGKAHVLHLDLAGTVFEPPMLPGVPDAVYYFATPRIYRRRSSAFDADLFAEFARFYLQRLAELCHWLESQAALEDRSIRVYVPSTIFVQERPRGMTEYAMAKAAAEVLGDDLNRTLRRVRVVHSRLPRLATDQTASVMGLNAASNVEALLPVVRRVSGRSG